MYVSVLNFIQMSRVFPTFTCLSGGSLCVNPLRRISSEFFFFLDGFFYSAIVDPEIDWMADWEYPVDPPKELCNDLLSNYKLKRPPLDPILHQLQGSGGSNLPFDNIIGVYQRIKDDYEGQAVGAKDAIAGAFFDFQPVSISFLLNVLHAAFDLVVACSVVRLALSLSLVWIYYVLFCCCYCCKFFPVFSSSLCPRLCSFLSSLAWFPFRPEKPPVSSQMTLIFSTGSPSSKYEHRRTSALVIVA